MKGFAVAQQQRGVEFLVGNAAGFAHAACAAHRVERAPHAIEMLLVAARRRERGGGRLDDAAQLEQSMEDFRLRFTRKNPGKHVRIEQMPFLQRAHARTDARPAVHQALGGEDPHGFAIGGARDPALLAGFDFAIEHVPGPVAPGDDQQPDVARDGTVQPQHLAAGRRTTGSPLFSWTFSQPFELFPKTPSIEILMSGSLDGCQSDHGAITQRTLHARIVRS